jgi:PAS domain S-box-containing protein
MDKPPHVVSDAAATTDPTATLPVSRDSLGSPNDSPKPGPRILAALLRTPGIDRLLLDSLSDAMVFVDVATGRIIDANEGAAAFVAFPVEALIGREHTDLHPEENRELYRELLAGIRDKGLPGPCCTTRPLTIQRSDGQRLPARFTIFTVRLDDRVRLCAVLHSPTAQDILESRLQDSEVDFAKVLPHIGEGVWSWMQNSNEVFLSDRWKEQLGFKPWEFPNSYKACMERLHPDDAQQAMPLFAQCAAGQTSSFAFEFRLRHKDGGYRWMFCRGAAIRDRLGRVVRLAGANTDVTNQKEAEQALRESEARFRLLSQNTPDAVFLHDMSGKVLDVNDRACSLLGYDRKRLLGLSVPDFEVSCPPEVLYGIWAKMQPGPFCFDGLARRADGSTFPTEVHGVAFIERGRTLSLVAARDLTLRKQYERGLAEARDAAMAASRAKTEFLANMSHEIRTPMNVILGMAEMLRETAVSSDQKRCLAALENSGRLLLHLLNDFLDISQIETNKLELRPQAFDPAALVGEVREFMRVPAQDKGLSLSVLCDPQLPSTMVNDPDRLRQVLVNLIWNAVKFTSTGGITVTAALADRTPGTSEPILRIEVMDTGIGIAPQDRQRIFAPFVQALDASGRRPEGTGLGLAICRRLVDSMGGAIDLDSTPGQGSRFFFTLPSLSRTVEAAAPLPACQCDAPAVADAPRRRLLLVEDSLANQEVIRLFLKDEPYDIAVAGSGREALEHFAPGRFDVVLMDMEMPEMDGCAATEAIRRLEAADGGPPTPVLMLSAHAFPAYKEKGLAAGCDAFLVKPIRRAMLLGALDNVLTGS